MLRMLPCAEACLFGIVGLILCAVRRYGESVLLGERLCMYPFGLLLELEHILMEDIYYGDLWSRRPPAPQRQCPVQSAQR